MSSLKLEARGDDFRLQARRHWLVLARPDGASKPRPGSAGSMLEPVELPGPGCTLFPLTLSRLPEDSALSHHVMHQR